MDLDHYLKSTYITVVFHQASTVRYETLIFSGTFTKTISFVVGH